VHPAPSLSTPTVGNLRDGTRINIVCQTRGSLVGRSTMWDKIDRPQGGYVADWYTSTPVVNNPSPGLPPCGQSPAPTPTASSVKLESNESARCLDADAAGLGGPGAKVQLWDCWPGANQNWQVGSDGTIRNAANGQCLDADLGTIRDNGTIVHLWPCLGTSNQRWTVGADGVIRSQYNGRCLDAAMSSIPNNGTKAELWDCNGGRNQSWTRFAPNTRVPDLCYTYTTGVDEVTKNFSYGLRAGVCYNGSTVSFHGVKTWCFNKIPGGVCKATARLSTGPYNVTQDFVVGTTYILPLPNPEPIPTMVAEYFTPYSSITVTPHGHLTRASDTGPPSFIEPDA
jgi:ricin-type beta-trefoil lectin protein